MMIWGFNEIMIEEPEEEICWDKVQCKMNIYMIHKLLWECRQTKMPDIEIWKDVKELFQSADYNLSMELRPIEMVWGDTTGINNLLNELTGVEDAKTNDT